MTGVTIQRARRRDRAAIARILWDFGDEAAWLPRVRRRAEEAGLIADLTRRGWVRVALRGGRVLGFVAAGEGEIHALYLAPEARGRGIGRALLAEVQAAHPRLGLWAHAANHPARRFYAAAGFRPVRIDAANDERLTEIRFEWEALA